MENNNHLGHNETLSVSQQKILDIFRITAAYFVLVGHSFSFYHLTIFKDQTYFMYLQNIGVVVFFLLSGFLMAYSLDNKNKLQQYTFAKFLTHKTKRIAREYLPGLVLIAIIDLIAILMNGDLYGYYKAYNVTQFISNALMLQNMGPHAILGKWLIPFGSGRPLWTLSIEWWLYMLFGAMYLYIANKEKITISKILVLGISIFMCSGYLIEGRGHGLGFVFALGMLGYYCYSLLDKNWSAIIFILSVLLYVVYGIIYKEAYTVYSVIILWMLLCAALKCTCGGGQSFTQRNTVIGFISKSTFMLYLIHYSIVDLICNSDTVWSIHTKFFAGIIISTLSSFLAYYIFGEKRLLDNLTEKCCKSLRAVNSNRNVRH